MKTLSEAQRRYLATIPVEKVAAIKPYTSRYRLIADSIIKQIREIDSGVDVRLLGAVGLGIAGQGDLDVYVLCAANEFDRYLRPLVERFGKPLHQHAQNVEWEFTREDVDVELYLSDPATDSMRERIEVFDILSGSPELKEEYEQLKLDADGHPFREYQRAKYEFYNRILNR